MIQKLGLASNFWQMKYNMTYAGVGACCQLLSRKYNTNDGEVGVWPQLLAIKIKHE